MRLKFTIIVLIILAASFFITYINLERLSTSQVPEIIGFTIYQLSLPNDCTDQELIALWNSVFDEPFDDIIGRILRESGSSQSTLCNFIIYEVNENNYLRFLGIEITTDSKTIYAGAYNMSLAVAFSTYDLAYDYLTWRLITLPRFGIVVGPSNPVFEEDVEDLPQDSGPFSPSWANDKFRSLYKLVPTGWSNVANGYAYEEVEEGDQKNLMETGIVFTHKEGMLFVYSEIDFESACQEGDIRNCPGGGICAGGNQVCFAGSWSACDVTPQEEVCDDDIDNDCDGVVDENCLCTEGDTQPCGPNLGICKDNRPLRTCRSGAWSDCEGGVTPVNETGNSCFDDLDNDCDGLIDEFDTDCIFINSCDDGIQNHGELAIDCGGSCPPCPDPCLNGILDGDETQVNVTINAQGTISDCGGTNCPACPTCSDSLQNQLEEGADCGGPCPALCPQPEIDSDNDGLTDSREGELGTDVYNADTDGDGTSDGSDTYPLCPNTSCDSDYGETIENCPDDCKKSKFPFFIILFPIIALVLLIIIYFILKRGKNKKEKGRPKLHPFLVQQSPRRSYSDKVAEELGKIK
ncbi:MAG: hypothetical protein ABIB47_00995 [Candidatus Woesearchaeota archaeon]